MPRSFPSLNAQGPCLRMRLVQSGPKFFDTLGVRSVAWQRLAPACRESTRQILDHSKMNGDKR